MKVSGFTFIRNAVQNDYPIKEAILSVLPLCAEFIVALGNSSDDTEALVKSINSEKIKIINTVWDENLREGGRVFAEETNKAIAQIAKDSDWMIYIQGDECLHEKYLPLIKKEMEATLNDKSVEALLLKYKHFYGSFDFFAESRRWYRREIRVLKNLPGVQSYRDAQGFRINNRKLNVKLIDAYVYHYGWVKPPQGINSKMRNFNQFYHGSDWVEQHIPTSDSFDYGNADKLICFKETQPAVMQERIQKANWKFSFDPTKQEIRKSKKRKFLQWFEDKTGIRLFEYRNYKIVK